MNDQLNERVIELLRSKPLFLLCDDCISKRLGAPRTDVADATRPLEGVAGFMRDEANCMDCGTYTEVTWAT
jgi:hypothetical protein